MSESSAPSDPAGAPPATLPEGPDYQRLVEDLRIGVLLQGPRAEILLSNQAALDLLGLTKEQLLGKTSFDPDWNVIHEDGSPFPGETHPVPVAIAERRAVRDVVMGVYRPRSGDRLWLLVNAEPQLDEDGRLRHVVCTFSDITARQRRIAEVTTVQRVAQAISSTMDLGAIFHTVVSQISRAFGYEMVSIFLREGDGLWLRADLGYQDIPCYIGLDEGVSGRVARTGQPVFVRDARADADFLFALPGTRQSIIVPLKDADGEVLGTLAVESTGMPDLAEDDLGMLTLLADQVSVAIVNVRLFAALEEELAERKRLEEERLELERQLLGAQQMETLGLLAAGTAHDFNNLLQVILGNATLARAAATDQARVVRSMDRIEAAARRAAELTQQLLAYAGKGRYIIQQIDLDATIAPAIVQIRPTLVEGIALRYEPAGASQTVLADETQICQIARNLILNAAEAIGDAAGTIAVTTGRQRLDREDLAAPQLAQDLPAGDYVYLDVADDGPGMDDATLARVFEPFFTTKFTGRGLGLPAVQGIARAHQGAVRVWSAPGRGTRVRVWLPAVVDAPADELEPAPIARATPSSGRRRQATVLVVDDEEGVRALMARLLERAGYAVLTASDGRAGIATFRTNPDAIACVLLDLTMPRMSGEQVLHELRATTPDVPIILMSAYSEAEATSRFDRHSLAGFLRKPFWPEELIGKIRGVIRET